MILLGSHVFNPRHQPGRVGSIGHCCLGCGRGFEMLKRRSIAMLLGAMAIPLCGLAIADSGMGTWGDHALVAEAKRRAANGLSASDALPNPEFDYRNLKVLRSGEESPFVCGEVKERHSITWTRFNFDVAKDETNLEPHPALSDATTRWYSTQCRAAVMRIRPGQRGSESDRRTCDVSAQLAEAQFERARFDLFPPC